LKFVLLLQTLSNNKRKDDVRLVVYAQKENPHDNENKINKDLPTK
jgi:hypothetical protein